ncbi:MAG TPA: glycosyltransferase family 4 protein [Anaerolineae bacterium]|nr:glycosyltransferase family 4 protein [Anaerolineae bacterium]
MRICFVAPPNTVHTRRWLSEVANRGHEVILLSNISPPADWPDTWLFHQLPDDFPGQLTTNMWRIINWTRSHQLVPAGRWLWGARRLRQLWAELQPDLVHLHYLDHLPICAALSAFQPLVATPWGSDLLVEPKSFTASQKQLFRHALSRVNHFMCNSVALENACQAWGVPAERISSRQWGVDRHQFHPQIDTTHLRQRWHIPADTFIILSPRSLRPVYNIPHVLTAFAQVRAQIPNALLLQFGGSSLTPDLEQQAESLGLTPHIRWLPFLDEDELPAIFNLAHVAISIPSSDSLPTSLLEAMACGTIPLFANLGGVPDWITDKSNGRLLPPADPAALAQALLWTHAQPDSWWQNARQQNETIINQRADRQKEFDAVITTYQQLHTESTA